MQLYAVYCLFYYIGKRDGANDLDKKQNFRKENKNF